MDLPDGEEAGQAGPHYGESMMDLRWRCPSTGCLMSSPATCEVRRKRAKQRPNPFYPCFTDARLRCGECKGPEKVPEQERRELK